MEKILELKGSGGVGKLKERCSQLSTLSERPI